MKDVVRYIKESHYDKDEEHDKETVSKNGCSDEEKEENDEENEDDFDDGTIISVDQVYEASLVDR